MPLGNSHLTTEQLIRREDIRNGIGPEVNEESNELEEVYLSSTEHVLSHQKEYSVLVVEDNVDVRTYLKVHLQKKYNVLEAVDGVEGYEIAQTKFPDLIISDVMMPRMDGNTLCHHIKNNPETSLIPVVLLTARVAEESRIEGLTAGADDYIFKPFNASELLARTENLIELRKRLHAHYKKTGVKLFSESWIASEDEQFIQKLYNIVESNMSNGTFNVSVLASELGISQRHLIRRIKETLGISPSGFIRLMRLERANQLLAADAGNVSEIAYKVGYNDPKHFSRVFKQVYGVLPSRVRENGLQPGISS